LYLYYEHMLIIKIRKLNVKIAIASGKGGTGKTTVATNLAKSVTDRTVVLADCDVEEPNAHLFLNPEIQDEKTVNTFIPVVDMEKCTLCGQCTEICQFQAIVNIKEKILVFPELCHSCFGCQRICPEMAIGDGHKEIGTISQGLSGHVRCVVGTLKIGEAMAPPLIKAVKKTAIIEAESDLLILDAPPGTSCPVIEAVKGTDFIVLVTEPTPFGLHDLKLAVEMVKIIGIPYGVIINRSDIGDRAVLDYCQRNQISVLMEIPEDRRIAESYSQGKLIIDALPEYQKVFRDLLKTIEEKTAGQEVAA